MRRVLLLFILLVSPSGTLLWSAVSCSTNFCLQQTTLNTAGQAISSTNFRTAASMGQEMTIGVSSSPHLVLQSGFWSFFGSGLVPVLLTATKNTGDSTLPDLSWTGNNPPYSIFRSSDCSDVYSGFIASTPFQAYTDTPPAGTLFCYSILATAPGDSPEPFAPSTQGSVTTLMDEKQKTWEYKSRPKD